MPAVFTPCCRSNSAKCFLFGHSDNRPTDIFLNQLIQFYSNNATNLRHLTTQNTTALTYKMVIVLRPQICDVISPYVLQLQPFKIQFLYSFAAVNWRSAAHSLSAIAGLLVYRGLIMAAPHILPLWFLLLSLFPSPILSGRTSQVGCPSYFHTWCGPSVNLECRSDMCCTRLAEIQDVKIRHLRTIAQLCRAISSYLRHLSTVGKIVKQQYLLHKSSQYGEVRPTSGWDQLKSSGHPSKFQRFRVLASLLHRRRLTEANQTLHDVWLSPGLVHYIHIFGGTCLLTEFCQVQNLLCAEVLRSPILAAGRPSRSTLAGRTV